MAVTPTYPGVYIEELPSGVHPITGVATSITAFVGFAPSGPVDEPTTVQSFPAYTRIFGGLVADSTMSYAVQQFFENGGQNALIVRCTNKAGAAATRAAKAFGTLTGAGGKTIALEAASEGEWGNDLVYEADNDFGVSPAPTDRFNLVITRDSTGEVLETLRNLLPGATLQAAVAARSQYVRVRTAPTAQPTLSTQKQLAGGQDGKIDAQLLAPAAADGTGVYALERADLFNLLVIPPPDQSYQPPGPAIDRVLPADVKGRAAKFCHDHRALFLVDPDPDWDEDADITRVTAGKTALETYLAQLSSNEQKGNAALYFPYLRAPDPLNGGILVEFPPAGAVAGVMARTDTARGVWKAPAGLDAGLAGVQELKAKLTDGENGNLNPLGVNCLRTFPAAGHVVWGARTLLGDDRLANEWKYVPVRRTALFLEESLFRGTQWVVFEPNDEPLWAQIRLNVGAFMQDLFRKGAFQGKTPREAYLVKCDAETTTQIDINNGVVNILVGFAPLKPAEFVIVQIQQLAGQIES